MPDPADAGLDSRTPPTGRVFISYRRTRADDRDRLLRALRAHGVPTWHDVCDLGPHSMAGQIREVLADPTTAGAVLWITPDLADSAFINDVELPELLERVARGDGFFLQPVAAGGLDPAVAGEIASSRLGIGNLAYWNVTRVASDPLDKADAASIARAVLRIRLAAVAAGLPPDAPLGLTLDTRRPAGFDPEEALQLDWSRDFNDDRFPEPRVWTEELELALQAVAEAVATLRPERSVRARGRLTLGVALALGYSFRDTTAVPLMWAQHFQGTWTDWSLAIPVEESGTTVEWEEHNLTSGEVALLVSARQSVKGAFGNTRASLPPLRGVVHVRWDGVETGAMMTPGQGVGVARHVRQALIRFRSEWRPRGGRIHLFIAAPAGLAVLIGQQLNTFGPVTVYEHVEATNSYAPALTFGAAAR